MTNINLSRRTIAFLAAFATIASVLVIQNILEEPASSSVSVRDGLTQENAAPSCWSAKQANPAATDGVYWLQTPQLIAPTQFYCDQTTDGGGWVLIGRGRENWAFDGAQQGNIPAIATTPTGPAAFAPAHYSATVVDQLLGDTRPDELADGIRLRRAADPAGNSWQEVRWNLQPGDGNFPGFHRWNWQFDESLELSSVSFDGVSAGSGNTYDTNVENGPKRIFTFKYSPHNNKPGFSYGRTVTNGSSASSSYLWEHDNEDNAIPFTQVYVRPKLDDTVAYPAIPASGTPELTTKGIMGNKAETLLAGVKTNLDPNDQFSNLNSLVMAFEQIGNTMFVGGEFQSAEQGKNGTVTPQPYLAAFNVDTGAWISSFRPQLDGTVFALESTPSGKLIVGGGFTQVNGQPNTAGLVALNPLTGAVDPSWNANLVRRFSTRAALTRTMDIKGDWLYVGGYFNWITGGSNQTGFGVGNLSRFSLADGTPDPSWRPVVGSTPYDIDASPDSPSLWVVGNFTALNATPAKQIGVVSMVNGTRIDPPNMQNWEPTTTDSSRFYQYAIEQHDGWVYMGGSEHNVDQYDLATFTRQSRNMTRAGGDTQALYGVDGIIYAGCHCFDYVYAGAQWWASNPRNGYYEKQAVSTFYAVDAQTGEPVREFRPRASAASEGSWTFETDSKGCMWVGGDYNVGSWNGSSMDYAGGFVKMCGENRVAPSVPNNLTSTIVGGSPQLSWAASTDDSSTPRYEILRGDRVIATTYSTTYVDPIPQSHSRYFVRAIDQAGNRSASTAGLDVNAPTPDVTLIDRGATWSYSDDGTDHTATIKNPAANLASWKTGPAPLGAGNIGEKTTIDPTKTTQYFSHNFNVADPATIGTLELKIRRDDAAVIYLNGNEINRTNIAFGTPKHTTPAYSEATPAAQGYYNTFPIPADYLLAGTNRITVEVHQHKAADTDAIFDLELNGKGTGTDQGSPTKPTVSSADKTANAVRINWTESTDDVGVVVYRVTRNGEVIDYRRAASSRTFVDQQLGPDAYLYEVTAIDAAGNESAAGSVAVSFQPPTVDVTLVARGATWSYSDDGTDHTATIKNPAANLAGWKTGPAPLGAGNIGEKTTIDPTKTTQYFSHNFNVADPATIGTLELKIRRDDAAVIYLNGNEINRTNIAFGTPKHTTPAYSEATPAAQGYYDTFAVPADYLSVGANRITVEVHQHKAADTDAIFDLELIGAAATGDLTPPAAPAVSSPSQTSSAITLDWTQSADNVGVVVYRIERDGFPVDFRRATSSRSFRDQQLPAGQSYTYTVTAIDRAGNESSPGSLVISTL